MVKRIVLLMVAVTILGMGAGLTLTAAIGVGAWDAFATTLSNLTMIEIGTCGMILNITCVLIQYLILKKGFTFKHLLQIPFSILLGVVINFMFYNVSAYIPTDTYLQRLVVLTLGTVIAAYSVSFIMTLNFITLALEGACVAVEKVTKIKFHILRQYVDIISIVVVFIITFITKTDLPIREGTIIGMIIFGPLIGFFGKYNQKILNKVI